MKRSVYGRIVISCVILCGILFGELGSPMQVWADEIVVEKESSSMEGTEFGEITDSSETKEELANSENTEIIENTTEEVENTEDAENTEDTENKEEAENTEETENTEEAGNTDKPGNTENPENTEATKKPVKVDKQEEMEKPIKPVSFRVKFKNYSYGRKQCTITWKAVSNSQIKQTKVEKPAIFYVVSVYSNKNKKWKQVVKTSGLNAKVNIPTYGTKYVYKVEAFWKRTKVVSKDEKTGKAIKKIEYVCIGKSEKLRICMPQKMDSITTTSTSSKKVKLSWKKVQGATMYQIFQKSQSGIFKKLMETSKDTVKLEVVLNEKYEYRIVPVYNDQSIGSIKIKATSNKVFYDNGVFVATDHQKYTYSEMASDISSLSKKYGEYVSYDVIGKSERGRNIYDVVLGNRNAKNCVLVVSTLHSREYVATVTLMKQLEYYLQNYNKKLDGVVPAQIFEKCCVHYIMMANPDGVTLCQNGDTRLKNNANNVNLNGNFPYKLSKEVAASQKETQAIVAITKKLKNTKNLYVVNYHAMGQIVFGDYSGSDMVLKTKIKNMYNIARQATGYADAGGYSGGGSSAGSYREYLSYVVKVPSITIEVGDVWCPVPQNRYASIINKNRFVILREAKYANSVLK